MVCVRLKTDTLVSKIAFRLIRSFKNKAVASTIGKTIHLHKITPEAFVENRAFLRHELQHAIQYQTIRFFALKYIWETLRKGYFQNKYEVEAREKSIHEFPKGYAVYNDDLFVIKKSDFPFIGPTVEFINHYYKTDFKKLPKVILR
jgi:hypothetical protein